MSSAAQKLESAIAEIGNGNKSRASVIQIAIDRIREQFSEIDEPMRVAIGELVKAANRNKMYAHDRDDWGTPPEAMAIVKSLGKIALDAAAHDNNAKARRFYSIEGEIQSWRDPHGLTWCNPPFSQKKKFAQKYAEESREQTRCVLLLGGTESTAASRIAYDASAAILRFATRIKFEGATTGAPFDVRLYFSRGFSPEELTKLAETEFDGVSFTMEMRAQ